MSPSEARYTLTEALFYHNWYWYEEAKYLLQKVAETIKDEEVEHESGK